MIKVVNPSVELWKQDGYDLENIFKHVARCARVCYQSTPKNKDENSYDFLVRTIFKGHDLLGYSNINVNDKIERILAQNSYGDLDLTSFHLSCCEHATVHLKYPLFMPRAAAQTTKFIHNIYSRTNEHEGYIYVTTNMRVLIEHQWMDELEFIDTTPNENNFYDGWIFNAPLLERISIIAIFKDPRQVEQLSCCGYSEADNLSFIATEVKTRLITKKLKYYRQLYQPPMPNNQIPK